MVGVFFPVAGQIKLSCFAEGKGIIFYYYYSLLLKLISSATYANLIGRIERNYFNFFRVDDDDE